MKQAAFVLALVAHCIVCRTALAGSGSDSFSIGIGTSLGLSTGQPFGSILVPLRLGAMLLLEPEFGGSYKNSGDGFTHTWSVVAALSALASWGSGPTRPVIGLRLGFTTVGTKVDGADASICGSGTRLVEGHSCVRDEDGNPNNNAIRTLPVTETNGGVLVGLTVGVEHFLSDALSVGVEGRLTYAGTDGGLFFADGLVAVRIYSK